MHNEPEVDDAYADRRSSYRQVLDAQVNCNSSRGVRLGRAAPRGSGPVAAHPLCPGDLRGKWPDGHDREGDLSGRPGQQGAWFLPVIERATPVLPSARHSHPGLQLCGAGRQLQDAACGPTITGRRSAVLAPVQPPNRDPAIQGRRSHVRA